MQRHRLWKSVHLVLLLLLFSMMLAFVLKTQQRFFRNHPSPHAPLPFPPTPPPAPLTTLISGTTMLSVQIGVCGASPRDTFGSRMNATRPTASACVSRTRTTNGRRFSRNAWKPRCSWSPDFVTGTRLPPISMYCARPSRTCARVAGQANGQLKRIGQKFEAFKCKFYEIVNGKNLTRFEAKIVMAR